MSKTVIVSAEERVEIVPDKLTFGKSLRHQHSRKADAATNISDLGTRL